MSLPQPVLDNRNSPDVRDDVAPFVVLIADDDTAYHDILAMALSSLPVVVYGAINGKQVLDIIQDASVDVVFMDVVMPEMDGINATSLVRELEASRRDQPIFIVGISGHSYRDQALAAGMNEFLFKPFSTKQLLQTVGCFLELRDYRLAAQRGTASA